MSATIRTDAPRSPRACVRSGTPRRIGIDVVAVRDQRPRRPAWRRSAHNVGGRHPREGRHDHLVAGPQPQGGQRKVQRRRTRGDREPWRTPCRSQIGARTRRTFGPWLSQPLRSGSRQANHSSSPMLGAAIWIVLAVSTASRLMPDPHDTGQTLLTKLLRRARRASHLQSRSVASDGDRPRLTVRIRAALQGSRLVPALGRSTRPLLAVPRAV